MFEAEVPKTSVFVSPKLMYIYIYIDSKNHICDMKNLRENDGTQELNGTSDRNWKLLRNIFPLDPASIFVETWRCCFPIT